MPAPQTEEKAHCSGLQLSHGVRMSSGYLILVMSIQDGRLEPAPGPGVQRQPPTGPEGWGPPPRTHTSSGAILSSSVYFLITCSGSGLDAPSGREQDVSTVRAGKVGRAMLSEEGSRQESQLRGGNVSRAESGKLAQRTGQPPVQAQDADAQPQPPARGQGRPWRQRIRNRAAHP